MRVIKLLKIGRQRRAPSLESLPNDLATELQWLRRRSGQPLPAGMVRQENTFTAECVRVALLYIRYKQTLHFWPHKLGLKELFLVSQLLDDEPIRNN